jgi:hypothetical protein
MKPEFIDNSRGNNLLDALRSHIDWLILTYREPVELSIATGYFDPEGFAMIIDKLAALKKTKLLLGAEPIPPPAKPKRKPGEPKGEKYDAELIKHTLQLNERGLYDDRNLMEFSPKMDDCIKKLIDFLESGKVEVRRYEKRFLHGKAYIFSTDEGVIAGSSNLTAAGLTRNLELNLGHFQPSLVRLVKSWFDNLWEEAVPYDLAAIYQARFEEYDPYLIYLRVLWERYKDEIEEEIQPGKRIRLTTFQNEGISRAHRILDKYNGVLIADGVGLGKTFIGGEIIRTITEENRQRALLISPATLRDGTWSRFADRHQLYLENISFEELAADIQVGTGRGNHLKFRPDEYSLIIIDEAHAFRNPETDRAKALRKLLQGDPPKNLVLMTATPVNNSLWDLYYLILYFIGQDAAFADIGIKSLKERFKKAEGEDPYELSPDLLFDILDTVTVRRTRHHVKKHYPNDRIIGPDGIEIAITFPDPHVEAVTYEMDAILPGFFKEFADALAPEEGEPAITLARYWPSRYEKGGTISGSELALVGLIRSAMLKRFESSAHAFEETCGRMIKANDAFLASIDRGYIPSPEVIEEWGEIDSDEALDALLSESGSEPATNYDIAKFRADITRDKELLKHFHQLSQKIKRDNDPKLEKLKEELIKIVQMAEKEGRDATEKRDKRKVIIFTYYSDTVKWVLDYLRDICKKEPELKCYKNRIAGIASDETVDGINRNSAMFGFAPRSTEAPPGQDEDKFDIVVTTDVLAEGVNLQQCRHIINFDLPWNPMRLVQRHGRIDRIGSPYKDVYIKCFFPDEELDVLLALEERIRLKLAQAAASIGLESEVIPGGSIRDVNFTETEQEIKALRDEDPTIFINAGEDPNAHSGEEYRQELRKGLEAREQDITNLPWAAGSGFRRGNRCGHFFCTKVGDKLFMRFIPLVGGDIIRDTLGCLKVISCSPETTRCIPPELAQSVYKAWETARRDIFSEWTIATDPANLQPKIRPLFRKLADHIRNYPPKETAQEGIDKLIDTLEAPWGIRYEKQFRVIYENEVLPSAQKTEQIAAKVKELGMQPFNAPKPLPVIEEDEVKLICWMAVG